MSYYAITYSDSLSHHGIKGQKWGKKNGPPYPLDAEDHSASEKKAGWKQSLDKGHKFHLTDKQKKYLKIGAAVAVTGLAVYGVYKLSSVAGGSVPTIPPNLTEAATEAVASELPKVVQTVAENPVKKAITGSVEDVLSDVDKSSWKDVKSSINRLKQLYEEGRVYSLGANYEENLKIKDLAHEFNAKNLFSKVQYDALSKDERGALNYYTTQAYTEMNEYLRHGKDPSNPLSKLATKSLEKALDKTALPKDIYIHRGVGYNLDKVGEMLGVSKDTLMIHDVNELKQKLVGHTFVEKGFMSCGGAEGDAWPGVKLHVNVPKGAKGMYIAPISAKESEHEFLLQRGSEFLINGVKRDKAGFLELYISLTNQP